MEIESKLEQADILSSEGQTQSEIAKALGISVMTFHRCAKQGDRIPPLPGHAVLASLSPTTALLYQIAPPELPNYSLKIRDCGGL